MKYSILILFFFVSSNIYSQNLVPNPSFEEYSECPQWLDDFNVDNWISPTWGSPDLYNICSEEQLGVPQNAVGWQQPNTGNGYVGIWLSDFTESQYREYIQCLLLSELESQEEYEVSFYISRADSSTKACSNFGLYLSDTPISSENNHNLPYIPQVTGNFNGIITDAVNWIYVIDTITAAGGEMYATLGVFTDNINTNWTQASGGWMGEAYYYVDDVSIKKINNVSIGKNDIINNNTVTIYPNPCNQKAEIVSSEIVTGYSIFSLSGQLLYKSNPNGNRFMIDVSDYSEGIYFISLEISNSISVCKLFIY